MLAAVRNENTARLARVDVESSRSATAESPGNLRQSVCAQGPAGLACRAVTAMGLPRRRGCEPGIRASNDLTHPVSGPLPFAVHKGCGCSDDKGVDKPREAAPQGTFQRVIKKSPHGAEWSRCALDLRTRVCVCTREARAGAQPAGSDHTANSLPLGSVKWKRRPPGKSNTGLRSVPPAACTFARVSSMRSL